MLIVAPAWLTPASAAPAALPEYTGCLTKEGTLYGLQSGSAPARKCKPRDFTVSLSAGVTAGTGLSVVGTQIAVDLAFRLPQDCQQGQLPFWDDTAKGWSCLHPGEELVEDAGTSPVTLRLKLPYRLPTGCNSGQLASWDGIAGRWSCVDAAGITAVAGDSAIDATTTDGKVALSLRAPYRLPQSCSVGQRPSWNGTSWDCADDAGLTGVEGGDGIAVSTDAGVATVSIPLAYRLPAGCAGGQVAKWNATDKRWDCADDTGISAVVAGAGLSGGGSNSPVTIQLAERGVTTTYLADASVTFDKLAKSAVRGEGAPGSSAPIQGNIALGTVTGEGGAPLPDNSASGDIALKTITRANIADFTIQGGQDTAPNQIEDGTITAYDLAAGAIDTSVVSSNAATGSNFTPIGGALTVNPTLQTASDTSTATVVTPRSGINPSGKKHNVLLTGQVQLACTAACPQGGEAIRVDWQLLENTGTADVPLGPAYSTQFTPNTSQLQTGSISFLDSNAAEGTATVYKLKITASTPSVTGGPWTVELHNAVLNAVDLGRSN